MKLKQFIFVAITGFFLIGCSTTPSSTHPIIPLADGTPSPELHCGQNAVIHYVLEDGTRRHKYCKIVSADEHWLTVADKAVKTPQSDHLSGWHSMIPIKNILMIRVEIDSE